MGSGAQIKATRLSDRYVTVKGLVERKVKSDLAIWPLTYKEAGNDLAAIYAKTEADKKAILKFLGDQGIQPNEIEIGVIRVVDTQANEYGGGHVLRTVTSPSSRLRSGPRASTRLQRQLKKPFSFCRTAWCWAGIRGRD